MANWDDSEINLHFQYYSHVLVQARTQGGQKDDQGPDMIEGPELTPNRENVINPGGDKLDLMEGNTSGSVIPRFRFNPVWSD
ncbi:MAG: hypothetical protein H7833_08765 [Magnetococcus sp. DMHC-1]